MNRVKIQNSKEEIDVHKILCLGRNYAAHAREMDADVPEMPVIFLKPPTAIIHNGDTILRPKISTELHHEVELVIVIGNGGKNIPARDARKHILGYALGLDMTLRDIQMAAKKQGLPWSIAKGFDTSAAVSDVIPSAQIKDPHDLTIRCSVNGVLKQESSTCKMIFSVDRLVEFISTIFTLETGDLIFTGTPEGVSEVKPGDVIEAELDGYLRISHPVATA